MYNMGKKLLFKRLLFIGIVCITIAGCKKESPTPPPTPDVAISLTANKDSLPADGISSLTVTAVVVYSDDDSPAAGLIVRFLTTMGKVTQRDTTDSNGCATATLVSDTVAGNSTITVYCSNKNSSITIPFYSVAQENVYIYSLTAIPDTIPANGSSQSFISAAFKYDGTNEPADSLVIYFSATLGGITYLDTTDANGLATAVLTSGTITGNSTVKVWYGDERDSTIVVFTEQTGDTTPASVVLYSVNPITIAVHGSGGNETSTLIFQVRDASGQPISGVRTVDFAIDGGPSGGEYIYPTFAPTDVEALATTHLNSGTISGPVRIVAQVQGTSIFSGPVQIAIVSGPPDTAHFTVVTAKLNLYAFRYAGVTDQITAFVGDKYGNPVLDGTSVWFTTGCGLIQPGSGTTTQGITSNTLVSCAPWPDTGFFWVQGWTIDGNGDIIQDSARILWSGDSYLTLSPMSFNISNGGSESFTIRVYDINNNPLTEGTSISVSADAGELRGETSTLIPDVQSRVWTEFQFQLLDDKPDTLDYRSCKLTVDLTSANGNRKITTYGGIY